MKGFGHQLLRKALNNLLGIMKAGICWQMPANVKYEKVSDFAWI
jgi:hypothetical protein